MLEAQHHSGHAGEELHHRFLLPALVRALRAFAPAPVTVLDVGCGAGYVSAEIARLGHRVIGIDLSDRALAAARAAYAGPTFAKASVYDDWSPLLPVERADVVMAVEVIEHLFSPRRFLLNVQRHLSPGGAVLLTTPYHGYLKNLAIAASGRWDRHHAVGWEGGHIKFFSPRTLAALLAETGFHDPAFQYAGRVTWMWKSMVCLARRSA